MCLFFDRLGFLVGSRSYIRVGSRLIIQSNVLLLVYWYGAGLCVCGLRVYVYIYIIEEEVAEEEETLNRIPVIRYLALRVY
jgi:hypothetical protein